MYFFIFSTSAFCEQVAEVDLEVVFQNLDLKEFEVDLGMSIEIINNTRGGIEGEIWERGDWGANSSPVCSLIHDVRRVFLLF